MVSDSYSTERKDQDDSLAGRAAATMEAQGLYLQAWLADEIARIGPLMDALAATYSGPHEASIKRTAHDLTEIGEYGIQETWTRLKERAREVRMGGYEKPLDAHLDMIDALAGFERLIRRVTVARMLVEEHWLPNADRPS